MPQVRLTAQEAAHNWFQLAKSTISITKNDVGYVWFEYEPENDLNCWLQGYCKGLYAAYQSIYLNWFTLAVTEILTTHLTT